jgi:Spy/CpxP family protein refolding chaperone
MDHYKVMKPLKNKMIELKASERTFMSEEKVDLKKVNSVIDQQTDLISQIKKLQAEQKVKIKSVFTDEQIMKLDQRRKIRSHKRVRAHRPISS